jgi:hypothetical protein
MNDQLVPVNVGGLRVELRGGGTYGTEQLLDIGAHVVAAGNLADPSTWPVPTVK